MEGRTHSSRGQAIVETTLVIIVILLIVGLAIGLTLRLRTDFKHDYVKTDSVTQAEEMPDLGLSLPGAHLFQKGSDIQNIKILKDEGWQELTHFRVEKQLIRILQKNKRHMIFSQNLGVETCLIDCDKN